MGTARGCPVEVRPQGQSLSPHLLSLLAAMTSGSTSASSRLSSPPSESTASPRADGGRGFDGSGGRRETDERTLPFPPLLPRLDPIPMAPTSPEDRDWSREGLDGFPAEGTESSPPGAGVGSVGAAFPGRVGQDPGSVVGGAARVAPIASSCSAKRCSMLRRDVTLDPGAAGSLPPTSPLLTSAAAAGALARRSGWDTGGTPPSEDPPPREEVERPGEGEGAASTEAEAVGGCSCRSPGRSPIPQLPAGGGGMRRVLEGAEEWGSWREDIVAPRRGGRVEGRREQSSVGVRVRAPSRAHAAFVPLRRAVVSREAEPRSVVSRLAASNRLPSRSALSRAPLSRSRLKVEGQEAARSRALERGV